MKYKYNYLLNLSLKFPKSPLTDKLGQMLQFSQKWDFLALTLYLYSLFIYNEDFKIRGTKRDKDLLNTSFFGFRNQISYSDLYCL